MPIRAHPPPARACVCSGPSARCTARTSRERARARARVYTRTRTRDIDDARRREEYARARLCASVYGTACVHGHEDLGSKRSRGPSGSDPSTPARIRHTRTPMLRGRARRCLGGVPGLYPAGLRLRLRLLLHLFLFLLDFFSPTLFALRPPLLPRPLYTFLSLFLLPVSLVLILRSPFFFSSSSFLPSPPRRGAHTCTSAELIAGRREKIAVM